MQILTLLAFAALAGLAAQARADDRQREFVPEANAYIKLSDRTRLFLLGDVTRNLTAGTTEGGSTARTWTTRSSRSCGPS